VSVGGGAGFGLAQALSAVAGPSAGPSTPAPAPAGLHIDASFGVPEALDADRYVLESGLLSSPNSADFEYDHLAGDDTSSFPFPTANFDFDFNDFITTDGEQQPVAPSGEQQQQLPQQHLRGRSVADSSSLLNLETPNPSEDPYLQPHPGASLDGCDDGGIAVGVL